MEEYHKLKRLVEDVAEDVYKAIGGNRAAGTRVRKAMQDIKAAAQEVRTGLADSLGDSQHPLSALDAAGTGNHAKMPATDFDARYINHTWFRVRIAGRQLERGQYRHNLGDTGNGTQGFFSQLLFVADDTDDRAVSAAAEVVLQTEPLDTLQDDDLESLWGHLNEQIGRYPSEEEYILYLMHPKDTVAMASFRDKYGEAPLALPTDVWREGLRKPGDTVEFEIAPGRKGPEAVDVKVV